MNQFFDEKNLSFEVQVRYKTNIGLPLNRMEIHSIRVIKGEKVTSA